MVEDAAATSSSNPNSPPPSPPSAGGVPSVPTAPTEYTDSRRLDLSVGAGTPLEGLLAAPVVLLCITFKPTAPILCDFFLGIVTQAAVRISRVLERSVNNKAFAVISWRVTPVADAVDHGIYRDRVEAISARLSGTRERRRGDDDGRRAEPESVRRCV